MQAVIFDMDGVLIDSEPMWKESEKHVFSSLGVTVTPELSAQSSAMTPKDVTAFWYNQHPWTGKSLEDAENEVVCHVEKLIKQRGKAIEGVKEVLELFQNRNFKIGLSTNAPAHLIPIVLNKLEIASYFQATSSSDEVEKGKPDPAVYLSTAKKLNIAPEKCIAIEDSVLGMMAAKTAGMTTIAVPSTVNFEDKRFDVSDLKLKRLLDITDLTLEALINPISR